MLQYQARICRVETPVKPLGEKSELSTTERGSTCGARPGPAGSGNARCFQPGTHRGQSRLAASPRPRTRDCDPASGSFDEGGPGTGDYGDGRNVVSALRGDTLIGAILPSFPPMTPT
jgi:hypothetical protein